MIKRVLAVGDVNMDIVFTGLTNIPLAEQDTLAQGLETVIGGQTGTIARAMARLGLAVSFVGRVGDDDYGRQAVAELVRAGVDVSGAVTDPSFKTGVTVVLSTGTERAMATFLGSICEVRRPDITPHLLANADHLHIGSYYLQTNLRPDMPDLFREAKRLGLTVSVDPGWDLSTTWGRDLMDVLHYVDAFLPNEVEAAAIARKNTLVEALEVLARHGNAVVVKLGSKGCVVRQGAETWYCPAFQVPVVDVTSAGDIFNAGFLYGFLHGWDMSRTARFANACGAISVSRVGSAGIMSSVAEVEAFLAARGDEKVIRAG